jgi:ABC-type molybdenum transport system ATPase subunit/photorepair protein PhrA
MTNIEKAKQEIIKLIDGGMSFYRLSQLTGIPANNLLKIRSDEWGATVKTMIKLEEVSKTSHTKKALKKIDAFIKKNSKYAICAKAGIGQSVLKNYNKQWNPQTYTVQRLESVI